MPSGSALRRTQVVVETSFVEGDAPAERALRKVGVVAVLLNPFAGRSVCDLSPAVERSADLGRMMARLGVDAMGGEAVESYGKGVVVGLNGEQEHGIAFVTTPFGDALREAIGGGAAWISSFSKRAAPGGTIDVPLAHKDALYVRSHYDGMTLTLSDAPLPDEIAVICCFANRGRLDARLGGLAAADIVGGDGLR